MKICSNCGARLGDDARFCTQCGMAMGSVNARTYESYDQGQNQYQYQQTIDPYDHTSEFDADDISDNKVYCMLVYLAGIIGIIVALLASGADRSAYINFHVRQGIKFFVVTTLSSLIALVLCWTVVVPVIYCIWEIIIIILKLIAFFQVCAGKAKEPAIIRLLPFLK